MPQLTSELIQAYGRLDTCALANAIERFDRRLRNEGFANSTIRGLFDDIPPVIGRAVTARIHCSTPPPVGHNYHERTEWWSYITSVPPPRFVVVEDADERPGTGAFVGEVHANILKTLECVGYATNGAVRDLPSVHAAGFQLFASCVAVSHAYAHIVDFGEAVTIGGLRISSGDILYGDRHGLLSIPEDLVEQLPAVCQQMSSAEQSVIALCRSPQFSLGRASNNR